MRIPFIAKVSDRSELGVEQDRFRFITATLGGSAFLLIADGAHLLILMWLHLDYTYFLAANVKVVLGGLFLYGALWPGSYPAQLTAAGVVSLVAAAFVWRDSRRTVRLYLRAVPASLMRE
jgi:hypothetical protein